MIVVFGSINMDLVARVERIARPGETVLSRRADSFFGGKGANQAVAAARVSHGGPIRVAMAGAVGKDPFGEACRKNLEENGVDIRAIRVTDEPTGCAFITVDGSGENAITVASGANMALAPPICRTTSCPRPPCWCCRWKSPSRRTWRSPPGRAGRG